MLDSKAHHESQLEAYIVQKLAAQGWLVGHTKDYNKEYAIYPEDLLAWVQDSQEATWQKLIKNESDPATTLMKRIAKSINEPNNDNIKILRNGFSLAGCGHISMSESAPEDMRNTAVLKRYSANRLRVVPQLKYHPTQEYAIDLVFFVNGLPVATVEIKTDFTQSVEAAIKQYKEDRLPIDKKTRRKEPLLTFKRGAIVHFAMSDSEIYMSTKLNGHDTYFLPFNKGNNGHAGNAARSDGEYPVAYFWEEVCQKDAWLRIFHNFVYMEKKDEPDIHGNWKKKETLIFPRYHQWEAVNAMLADAHKHGVGVQYLCEHSAGSGKTSTIAWMAHGLTKLRHADGTPTFNSIIIVTDRIVLDNQLQEAVCQIDHQIGFIATINRDESSDSKSTQLYDSLKNDTAIIVVTISTFPHALEAIVTEEVLKNKNFAVIIDEAHTSQTGSTATKLQAALSMDNMDSLTVEELLETLQQSRVRPNNISHFAFTATPKHSTFMLFGRTADGQKASDDNLPEAFHRYPMRQAIEENFILDVLHGYMPYKTAYNLKKEIDDQGRVKGKDAKRALAQWMNLHPTNVTQKVQFILEHFTKNVAHLLDGKAKAMVVTSSRAAAVRYKKAFDDFIQNNEKFSSIQTLVAFSGKLTGKQIIHAEDYALDKNIFAIDEDAEFTEKSMNPRNFGADLRKTFERQEYRLMIVANKFQTGFDQPKLVAMYIDKKIANDIEIVQTFSRLNRIAPGKDATFIIDFVNSPENVQRAFKMFDDGAEIDQAQDPNVVYEIKGELDGFGIYSDNDLEKFKMARFRSLKDFTNVKEPQHKELYKATEEPTRIYNERLKNLQAEEEQLEKIFEQARAQKHTDVQEQIEFQRRNISEQLNALAQFKSRLGRFCRVYVYLAQIIDFGDPGLEVFAAFAKLLFQRLKGTPKENIDLTGIVLSGYAITSLSPPDISNIPKIILTPTTINSGDPAPEPVDYLKDIIERLNTIFGNVTPLEDQVVFVDHIASIIRKNDTVMAQINANNPKETVLEANLPGAVNSSILHARNSHTTLANHLLNPNDTQLKTALTEIIYDLLHKNLKLAVGE